MITETYSPAEEAFNRHRQTLGLIAGPLAARTAAVCSALSVIVLKRSFGYSTVTDFARFLGWSTSRPARRAT